MSSSIRTKFPNTSNILEQSGIKRFSFLSSKFPRQQHTFKNLKLKEKKTANQNIKRYIIPWHEISLRNHVPSNKIRIFREELLSQDRIRDQYLETGRSSVRLKSIEPTIVPISRVSGWLSWLAKWVESLAHGIADRRCQILRMPHDRARIGRVYRWIIDRRAIVARWNSF